MAALKILSARNINRVRFPDFTLDEFKCPCCGEVNLNAEFIDMIQKARTMAGVKFIVRKGGCCRCNPFQRQLFEQKKTARLDSRHLMNRDDGTTAIDIEATNPLTRGKIVVALIRCGIHSITIYESRGFIHVDDYAYDYIKIVP